MARIPEEEIARRKREVSIERLVEALGVKLKRHGADLVGLCPFHEDKTRAKRSGLTSSSHCENLIVNAYY